MSGHLAVQGDYLELEAVLLLSSTLHTARLDPPATQRGIRAELVLDASSAQGCGAAPLGTSPAAGREKRKKRFHSSFTTSDMKQLPPITAAAGARN